MPTKDVKQSFLVRSISIIFLWSGTPAFGNYDYYLSSMAPGDSVLYGRDGGDVLNGVFDWLGTNIKAGDVNGDGKQDLIISALAADGPLNSRSNCGEVYVFYGSSAMPATLDLFSVVPDITIFGANVDDGAGEDLASCDINGDGFSEVIITAPWADGPSGAVSTSGSVYILKGGASLPATIDLASPPAGTTTVFGPEAMVLMSSLACGDVTGDSNSDLIIGMSGLSGPASVRSGCGELFVIEGKGSLPATIDLAVPGSYQSMIYGAAVNDGLASSLTVGDINGDGKGDIAAGLPSSSGPGGTRSPQAGEVCVVYGAAALPATLDLATMGAQGLVIYGAHSNGYLGEGLACGDVNGDGKADIVAGAFGESGPLSGRTACGNVYVVYGSASLPVSIDLLVPGSQDCIIFGAVITDAAGRGVGAGDLDGDGKKDILIGDDYVGTQIIHGSLSLPTTIDLASYSEIAVYGESGTSGVYQTSNFANWIWSADLDADGKDDLIVGTKVGEGPGNSRDQCGQAYVLRGPIQPQSTATSVATFTTTPTKTMTPTPTSLSSTQTLTPSHTLTQTPTGTESRTSTHSPTLTATPGEGRIVTALMVPNPVTDGTPKLSLAVQGLFDRVTVKIFTAGGRRVGNWEAESLAFGLATYPLKMELANGTYHYLVEVHAGNKVLSRKAGSFFVIR